MQEFDARRAALDLVTAFVNNNSLKASELPGLLSDVFGAIAGFEEAGSTAAPSSEPAGTQEVVMVTETEVAETAAAPELEVHLPRVSIKESLGDPNHIISMITGEKLKTLKRHLTRHGLTDAQYRERYGLPDDYPMVAPAYSELRRSVAKMMGLGRKQKSESPKAGKAVRARKDAKPAPTDAVSTQSGSSPKRRSAKSKRTASAEAKKEGASAASPEVSTASAPSTTHPAAEQPKPRAGRKAKAASARKAPKTRVKASDAKASPATRKASVSNTKPKADADKMDSPVETDGGSTVSSEPETSRRRKLTPAFSG